MMLEKNLEQINLMYHQLVTQKSELKIVNIVWKLIILDFRKENKEKTGKVKSA